MMTDDEIIAVVKARKEGKAIQRAAPAFAWQDCKEKEPWNFEVYAYRVKPEHFVCWVNCYFDGIVAYSSKESAINCAASYATRTAVKMVEADDQQ